MYGLEAAAVELPSERDQNFHLRDSAGAQFVLKISNAEEALEVLDLQNKALKFLAGGDTGLDWPRVIPTRSGNEIVPIGPKSGPAYFIRLLTWVEGRCLGYVRPHGPELLASLGRGLAATDTALAGFSHHAAQRTLYWDLRNAALARRHAGLLTEPERRTVEPVFDAWEKLDWRTLARRRDPRRRQRLQHPGG